MNNNNGAESLALIIGIIIMSIFAFATVKQANAVKPHDMHYDPVTSSAYKLIPKKKAYVYTSPNRKKKLFTLKKDKTIYIPDKFLVSEDYGGDGENGINEGTKLGTKTIKFGKKKGLAPIMLMDHFNYEHGTNFDGQYRARQLWNTRMFIDAKQFKIKHIKHINLYQQGKKHKLAFIDTCDPYVFRAKDNKHGDNDDDLWWLPIYIYQNQQNVLLNSTDDDDAVEHSDQDEDEIDKNTTSHPEDEEENNDEDDEDTITDNDDDNTNNSDDDEENTTENDDNDSFGGGDDDSVTTTETTGETSVGEE